MIKIRLDRDVGKNIQQARRNKKLTQEQTIAKLQLMEVDISRSTYAKIETNRINIRVSELIALSMIFEVEVAYFFQDLMY